MSTFVQWLLFNRLWIWQKKKKKDKNIQVGEKIAKIFVTHFQRYYHLQTHFCLLETSIRNGS